MATVDIADIDMPTDRKTCTAYFSSGIYKNKRQGSICGVPGQYLPSAYFHVSGILKFTVEINSKDKKPHLMFQVSELYVHQLSVKASTKKKNNHTWGVYFLIGGATSKNITRITRPVMTMSDLIDEKNHTMKLVTFSGNGNSGINYNNSYNDDRFRKYRLNFAKKMSGTWEMDLDPKANSRGWLDLGIFNPYDPNNSEIPICKDLKGDEYVSLCCAAPIFYTAKPTNSITLSAGLINIKELTQLKIDYYPNARNNADSITLDNTYNTFDSCNRTKDQGTAKSTGNMKKYKNGNWIDLRNQYGS